MLDPKLRKLGDVHTNLTISCTYLNTEQKVHFLSIYIKRKLMEKFEERKDVIDKSIDEVPMYLFDIIRIGMGELEKQAAARLLIESISLRLYVNGVTDVDNDAIYNAIYTFSEKYSN